MMGVLQVATIAILFLSPLLTIYVAGEIRAEYLIRRASQRERQRHGLPDGSRAHVHRHQLETMLLLAAAEQAVPRQMCEVCERDFADVFYAAIHSPDSQGSCEFLNVCPACARAVSPGTFACLKPEWRQHWQKGTPGVD